MADPGANPRAWTDRDRFRSVAPRVPVGARVPVETWVRVEHPFRAHRRARTGDGGQDPTGGDNTEGEQ